MRTLKAPRILTRSRPDCGLARANIVRMRDGRVLGHCGMSVAMGGVAIPLEQCRIPHGQHVIYMFYLNDTNL